VFGELAVRSAPSFGNQSLGGTGTETLSGTSEEFKQIDGSVRNEKTKGLQSGRQKDEMEPLSEKESLTTGRSSFERLKVTSRNSFPPETHARPED